MRTVSIDSDDDAIFPEEIAKKNSVDRTNALQKMRYLRKTYASLAFVFLIFAIASMILFFTPGVREFVQQYQIVVYLCVPLPLVSRFLYSVVERLRSSRSVFDLLFNFIALVLHLLSIFLSLTSLSLFFDTEYFYFTCYTVFLTLIILTLYSFQNYKILSLPYEMTLFLLVACVANVFLVEIILSIFDFPYIEIVALSLIVSMYIEHNIRFFMRLFNSDEWPMAVSFVFTRVPL